MREERGSTSCIIDIKRIDHFRRHDVVSDRDIVSGDRGPGRMPYEADGRANFRP